MRLVWCWWLTWVLLVQGLATAMAPLQGLRHTHRSTLSTTIQVSHQGVVDSTQRRSADPKRELGHELKHAQGQRHHHAPQEATVVVQGESDGQATTTMVSGTFDAVSPAALRVPSRQLGHDLPSHVAWHALNTLSPSEDRPPMA